ncbi:MAG: ABC transporter substrate-binding protein, partial [Candidatus Scatosoma sp.]
MKKRMMKIVSGLMGTVLCCTAMGACGSTSSDVQFWVYGSSAQLNMYTILTEKFNETYGAENGIYVSISQKPNGSYAQTVQVSANSTSGPDVFFVSDDAFKGWIIAGYFCPIQEYVDQVSDLDITDIMPNTINRLRYNVETNTSHEDDPLYGLPLDNQPTALYYNQTMLENAGIIVISVDEEDLDKWNNNEIADKNGHYKREYAKLDGVTVPAKGYFRSGNLYYYNGERTKAWVKPDFSGGEIGVFNNRIAMNWDEVEDLAMLFSGSYNPATGEAGKANPKTEFGTQYGYFTEWWFNYGWSVGGDCLNDLTDNGDWNFSLLDPNPNYVVKEGTFQGRTGHVYTEGETINFVDKMNIYSKNGTDEILVPDIYGDYVHDNENVQKDQDGNVTGGDYAGIWEGIAAGLETGALGELPSTRDAFSRYLKLGAKQNADVDGDSGLNISPNPSTFASRTSMNYFFSGELALLANTSVYMADLSEQAKKRGFEWDVAPLVVYKEYEDPSDPYCDEIKVQGKQAG